MYDYAGHLVRLHARNPQHLTGVVLSFKDARMKADLTAVIGHQGHSGRFAPWNWERQFHSFFHAIGEIWKHVAQEKGKWASYRENWANSMIRGRV